jgi:hypothetical protein
MKQIDLAPDEYRDAEAEIAERLEAMKTSEPPEMIPPPKPVMPDIKWVKPKIVDGKAVYRGRK